MKLDVIGTKGVHMRSEIAEQPARWLDLLKSQKESIEAAALLFEATKPELIVFVARGSSDHAAQYGQYLTHNILGIPALLSTPSTVTAFEKSLRFPRTIMFAVSQSGESPDLLATVQDTGNAGVSVIAFTNNANSSLAKIADIHVSLDSGPEISVAATKTYTAELLALYATIMRASGTEWSQITSSVEIAAGVAQDIISDVPSRIAGFTEDLLHADRVLVIGRGYSMSTAKEGALKLMETNSIAASGWSAADAKHGPLAQVINGTPVILLTASPGGRDSVRALGVDVEDLGGRVFAIDQEFLGLVQSHVDVALIPLLEVIPLQQLALNLAVARGLDPDRPLGLLKVTKTI